LRNPSLCRGSEDGFRKGSTHPTAFKCADDQEKENK
jgi:hypothetical protein